MIAEPTPAASADEVTEKAALSGVSVAEKKFLREGILAGCRTDGRRCDEFRKLQVATGVVPSAFGSARVRNTECDVICVIKADLCGPSLINPNEGKFAVNVQFASALVADHQLRAFSDDAASANQRLACALLNGPLNPKFLDRRALVVVKDRFVWKITVDLMVLTFGGSLLDVSAAALIAALNTTKLPLIKVILENDVETAGEDEDDEPDDSDEELEVQDSSIASAEDAGYFDMKYIRLTRLLSFDVDSQRRFVPFPCVQQIPLLVSIGQVEGNLVCDMTGEERMAVDTIIIALVAQGGNLLGLRKEGGLPVTLGLLTTLGPTLRQAGKALYSSLLSACSRAQQSNTYSWCSDMRTV